MGLRPGLIDFLTAARQKFKQLIGSDEPLDSSDIDTALRQLR